jgi:phage baseplate assembly protein gpV
MSNLIGNLPNQVPTNADLGGLAYQDPDYAIVGNINVEANLISSNLVSTTASIIGNITTANLNTGNATLTGSATVVGNITMTGGNIYLNTSYYAYDGNAAISKSYVDTASIIWGF